MLLEVDTGWVLQMPHGIGNPHERVWLMPGGVVDGSDPFIAHLIKGQEHKFRAAKLDAKLSDVPPVLENERKVWNNKPNPTAKTEVKRAEALKTAAATGSTSGIEVPTIGGKRK
jgi:hypothetical protein